MPVKIKSKNRTEVKITVLNVNEKTVSEDKHETKLMSFKSYWCIVDWTHNNFFIKLFYKQLAKQKF